ncbi:winged helix-turn-helix domain-containing protein [Streptomyces sp. NPDC054804]
MVVNKGNVAVGRGKGASPQEIADVLRRRIRVGDLKRGDRLPTQSQLEGEFQAGRSVVRQALRLLQDEGLLSDVGKGSPPRVAESPAPSAEPRPTAVVLSPRLVEAFAASDVRIDVVSHTTETLMTALGEPLRLIHEGRISPARIDVRILVPSPDINLAFPVLVEDNEEDDRVHRRWLSMLDSRGQSVQHLLEALQSTHGIEVSVAFRALPFTPPVKTYLLNGREALIGYYTLTRRGERFESGQLDMYDSLGSMSILFAFTKQAGGRDAAFVEEAQRWFDALWETIATDLRLS